jgi:hypothetical protein
MRRWVERHHGVHIIARKPKRTGHDDTVLTASRQLQNSIFRIFTMRMIIVSSRNVMCAYGNGVSHLLRHEKSMPATRSRDMHIFEQNPGWIDWSD